MYSSYRRRSHGDRVDDNRSYRREEHGGPFGRTSRLHISGLTRNVTEGHLREIFGSYGSLEKCELALDRTYGHSCRYGYVEYKAAEDAKRAFNYLNGGQIDGNIVHLKALPAVVKRDSFERSDQYMEHRGRERSYSRGRRRHFNETDARHSDQGRRKMDEYIKDDYRREMSRREDDRRNGDYRRQGEYRRDQGYGSRDRGRPYNRRETLRRDGRTIRSRSPYERKRDRYRSPPRRGRSPGPRKSSPVRQYNKRSSSSLSRSISRGRSTSYSTSSRSASRSRSSKSYSSESRSSRSRSVSSRSRTPSSRSRSRSYSTSLSR